ncbi:hypothetical protein [Amycolatopsis minnesotensis]
MTVTRLYRQSKLAAIVAEESLLRRIRRVLPVTGPLSWSVKYPVYKILVALPELHNELLMALRASQHDLFGDVPAQVSLDLVSSLEVTQDVIAHDELLKALRNRK